MPAFVNRTEELSRLHDLYETDRRHRSRTNAVFLLTAFEGVTMTERWDALFDRAREYDVDLDTICERADELEGDQ